MIARRGESLALTDDQRRDIGRELSVMLEELEDQHDEMYDQIQKAWSRYEAEKAAETKTIPWRGASNAVIPLTRIHADATHARYALLIRSGDKVWVAKSGNEEFVKKGLHRDLPDFLNWAARNEFDLEEADASWSLELIVVGSGVLALGWETETATVAVPGTEGKDTIEVMVRNGPVVEHVPREHCLWDMNYHAWDAPLFARRSFLTWPDIVRRVNEADWDWEAAQKVRGNTIGSGGASSPGVEVALEKMERGGAEPGVGPKASQLHEIWEVWVDWPVLSRSSGITALEDMEEGDVTSTIVVFLNKETRQVLQATTKPYAIRAKPFYDAYFKRRSGTYSSVGLSYIIRDMQEVVSTMVNQAVDAVTRANTITGTTSDPNLANTEFEINQLAYSMDSGNIQELGKTKNIMPDMALMQQMNIVAERLTGISDPALGRETRMGGHPAPATSTLSLLQEGKKLDIPAIRSIRQCFKRLGMDILMLYQQYGQTEGGKIIRAMGTEDGMRVLEWLFPQEPILGNVELDLAAISETMNPDVERQKAMATFQVTANFYALVTQYLGIVSNPQAPQALAASMLKGLQALQASFQKILESNDVDDIRAFLLDLEQLSRTAAGERAAAQRSLAQSPYGAAASAVASQGGGNGAAMGSGLGG